MEDDKTKGMGGARDEDLRQTYRQTYQEYTTADFLDKLKVHRRIYREYLGGVRDAEKALKAKLQTDPEACMKDVLDASFIWMQWLSKQAEDRWGLDLLAVYPPGAENELSLSFEGDFPVRDYFDLCKVLAEYMSKWRVFDYASSEEATADGLCEYYLREQRAMPLRECFAIHSLKGMLEVQGDKADADKCNGWLSEVLTGYVAARTSTATESHERRDRTELRQRLAREGGSWDERLLVELVPEVLDAFYTLGTEGVIDLEMKNLTARARRKVRREGAETSIKDFRLAESSTDATEGAGDDEGFGEFDARETARRVLDALEQEAALSPQQTRIIAAERRGADVSEIAVELGTSENNVSQQKSKAYDKMYAGREAAGF